jgi:hypothetical protein
VKPPSSMKSKSMFMPLMIWIRAFWQQDFRMIFGPVK